MVISTRSCPFCPRGIYTVGLYVTISAGRQIYRATRKPSSYPTEILHLRFARPRNYGVRSFSGMQHVPNRTDLPDSRAG